MTTARQAAASAAAAPAGPAGPTGPAATSAGSAGSAAESSASPTAGPPGSAGPKVPAAAAVTVTLWASAFIVIRGAGPHFDPGAMALLRMIVGSVVLGVIAAVGGVRWPPRRAVPLLVGWGVAWFCVYNLALNAASA